MSYQSSTSVRLVDAGNTAGWAGTDVGGWINSAYANLPASGGRIKVSPNFAGVAYNFTTPIVFGVNGKLVTLEGDTGGTTLNFTPTSGTAITMDWGQGASCGPGIRDIILTGACATNACSGVTSIGLTLGPTNGAVGGYFLNFHIGTPTGSGFLNGINIPGGSAYLDAFINSFIYRCNVGVNQGASGSNEGLKFMHGSISQNATGFALAGGNDVYFEDLSFDDNTTVGGTCSGSAQMHFRNVHWENSGLGTAQYLTVTGSCTMDMSGGFMADDVTSSTQGQFISWGGLQFNIDGTVLSSAGRTVTQAINITTGGGVLKFINTQGARIPANFNSGILTTNRILDLSFRDNVAPTFQTAFWNMSLGTGAGAGTFIPGATVVASLPSAASNPGAIMYVTDSTSVASEGQTCVGSSSNKALAFSNGTVWKCF